MLHLTHNIGNHISSLHMFPPALHTQRDLRGTSRTLLGKFTIQTHRLSPKEAGYVVCVPNLNVGKALFVRIVAGIPSQRLKRGGFYSDTYYMYVIPKHSGLHTLCIQILFNYFGDDVILQRHFIFFYIMTH